MQRLPSKTTFYNKRILPFMFGGFLLLFAAVPLIASRGRAPIEFLIMPAVMAVFFLVLFKFLIFNLVDEVWDAGDALIVRNKGREDRIPLASITNVNYSPYINPPRVTLSLRAPSVFGDKVAFGAPLRFIPFTTSPLIDELIKRIDAARQRAR